MSYVTAAELMGRSTGSRKPGRRRRKAWGRPLSSYMTPGERAERGDVPPVGSGMGDVASVVKDVLNAVGLRDPISVYEPGLALPDVFKKYSQDVDGLAKEIPLLRSATAQGPLLAALAPLRQLRDRIAPAFAPGTVPGERDRDRLNELVQGVRNLRRDWHAAKAQYGVNPVTKVTVNIPRATPYEEVTPAPKKSGLGKWGLLLLSLPFILR